jgi:hypothetical protein
MPKSYTINQLPLVLESIDRGERPIPTNVVLKGDKVIYDGTKKNTRLVYRGVYYKYVVVM